MVDPVKRQLELDRLRADARYARERRDLYRARAYGQRPISPERLRELEREAGAAADRLAFAEGTPAGDGPGDQPVID